MEILNKKSHHESSSHSKMPKGQRCKGGKEENCKIEEASHLHQISMIHESHEEPNGHIPTARVLKLHIHHQTLRTSQERRRNVMPTTLIKRSSIIIILLRPVSSFI